MLDTGAARLSTAGCGQAQAYMNKFNASMDTSSHNKVQAQFGIGMTTSIGILTVNSPIGNIDFHVVQAETPFLLCLQDMDKLGIFFNNLKDVIIKRDGSILPVIRLFMHPFLVWGDESVNYLTETELRQLHRRFGHPSVNRLVRTLNRAGHEDLKHRSILNHINKYCKFCQTHARSPGRFKFVLKDDTYFNQSLSIDVMYIDANPILQVVDESTSFQAARWLQNMTAGHTWDTLRLCWIDVYSGPPEIIVHDAGSNFDSSEFRMNASSTAIKVKCIPIEAPQSIGLVERYHAPLRRAYSIITDELKGQTSTKEIRLQMAVKAVNDTAGYDGLVPTLLVFGTYPRMSNSDAPTLSTAERARSIKSAMTEVAKLHAKRQVRDALHQRNGPNISQIHDSPIGSLVLVWRIHQKKWTGPYKLLAIKDETCTVELPSGPTEFRTTIVKPFFEESTTNDKNNKTTENHEPNPNESPTPDSNTTLRRNPARSRRLPGRYNEPDIEIHLIEPSFRSSRLAELNGLLERGVFKLISRHDVPTKSRIFGCRFVDQIKNEGTEKAFEKSRLVVQAYNDAGKGCILTQAPTIQRASQRLILILSLIFDLSIYTRDISQAYTQSNSKLARDVYIHAPFEMNLPRDTVLKVILPLYGVPESGNHWFKTYHTHHTKRLGMSSSTFDECLLFRNDVSAIVGLQTDDSLIAASSEFMKIEARELEAAKLIAKPCEKLNNENSLNFNGFDIELQDTDILITQKRQTEKIKLLTKEFSKDEYISQRARGAYIASISQPKASFSLSYAAQITEPTWEDALFLNKCLILQKEGHGLRFVKLDLDSLQILAFTDSSFANNKDCTSQIGYVVVLADASGNANILHWQSIKCRRVTRSVLASELYALSHGFDTASTIKSTLSQICSKNIPLIMCIDSHSLYDCLVKLGTTKEKRLMVDLLCLRQSYERREITEILWIKGEKNPADAMTKAKACDALQKLIETNKLDIELDGWVERQDQNIICKNEEVKNLD